MEDGNPNNVTKLPGPGFGVEIGKATPFRLVRGISRTRKGYCMHAQAIVDPQARIVECAVCHVDLDPIEILARISNDGSWCEHLHRERGRLGEEVRQLKAEASRLRSTVRRKRDSAGV